MSEARVKIHPDAGSLAAAIAQRLIARLSAVQRRRGEATVVLTGGTLGIASLRAAAEAANLSDVDWSRVNFWWGDERFVGNADEDRNARQAEEALLSAIDVDPMRVHRFGSTNEYDDVEAAAAAYAAELALAAAQEHENKTAAEREAAGRAARLPQFDVLLLGVGPDAHIASLFPEMAGIRTKHQSTVGVTDAPKPPPLRVSLTLEAINSADEVWIGVAGSDKAGAVGLALAGAAPVQVPAAGAAGRNKTLWLIDQAAAAQIPESLMISESVEP